MADPTSPLTPIASQTSVAASATATEAPSPIPAQISKLAGSAGSGAGKGRGKRASGADSSKQQDSNDGGEDGDGQPPKKRRAAAVSGRAKRIIDESDDEAVPVSQQGLEPNISKQNASPAAGGTKLKLKLGRQSSSLPAPAPAPTTLAADDIQSSSATILPPTAQPAPAAPLTVDNLFDDAVAPPANTAEAAVNPPTTSAAPERVKSAKVLPPGRLKAAPGGAATPISETEASGSKMPKKGGAPSNIARSGSSASLSSAKKPLKRPTGSNSSTSTPRPATHAQAPVKAAEPSFLDSLFSGIVPQTEHEKQAQKEREEKARIAKAAKQAKEKEEKAKLAINASMKMAKDKEKKDKEKDKATTATPNLNSKASDMATPKSGLAQAGKSLASASPSAFLQNSRINSLAAGRNSNLQARLAGQHESRKDEIQRLRTEARREREKVAAAGGFDLLAQSLEMATVEVPFFKDWNSHQQLAYQARSDRPTFPFYNHRGPLRSAAGANGTPSAQEEEDEDEEGQVTKSSSNTPAQPLPHPWTFGAAFIFAGARK